jgi:hypothetical protein
MKTILILVVGIWMGKQIYSTRASNLARENDYLLRKKLETFFNENFPGLPSVEIKEKIKDILQGLHKVI